MSYLDESQSGTDRPLKNNQGTLVKLMSHPKIVKEEKMQDHHRLFLQEKISEETCWTSPHDRG